jgi:predicted nucleotidyltransferase
MKREKVLKILHDHQAELEARGIRNLALFGSVARDEAQPESDVDILVEFDRPVGLFALVELQEYLEDILGCEVDLGTPDSLKERIRQNVMEDCYYVTPPMG